MSGTCREKGSQNRKRKDMTQTSINLCKKIYWSNKKPKQTYIMKSDSRNKINYEIHIKITKSKSNTYKKNTKNKSTKNEVIQQEIAKWNKK